MVQLDEEIGVLDTDLLLLSARNGYTNTVRDLLREGVDLNARDDTGRTPLIHAAEQGRTEIVRELLGAGADLWALTDSGKTADVLARDEEIRTLLREAMANRAKES